MEKLFHLSLPELKQMEFSLFSKYFLLLYDLLSKGCQVEKITIGLGAFEF